MTIHFPDLSHYPDADPHKAGTQTLDLHDVVALITKATEGASYVDPTYATYRDRAHAEGIPFVAFHWLHAADIPGQARHAFSVVGPDVPLMIDDEDPDDGLSVARTVAFVKAYRALGGLVTLEYLPHWFWQEHNSPSLQPFKDLGLALVSSSYTTYSDGGPGWASYGGMAPAIWQHTSSAALDGAAKVDINAFKGTVAELRALFGGHSHEGEEDMGTALDTWDSAEVDVIAPGAAVVSAGNATWRPKGTLEWLVNHVHNIEVTLTKDNAPALAAEIAKLLPAGQTITEAMLEAALLTVLKQLASAG